MKTKIPFILCLIATSFCFNPLFAKKVEVNVAKQVASNFFIEQSKVPLLAKSVSITQDFTVSDNSLPIYYVFNINNGFVIVSADDAITPVLGYSNESTYSEENQSPEFAYWMNLYKKQIINVINTGYTGTAKTAAEWTRLNTASENFKAVKSTNPAVPQLTFTTWDQGCCYNAKCPYDVTATTECSHVVTGCVATSMAQEMFYFKYPTQGVGSHSYAAGSTYGTLSANFGTTTYSWNAMTLACTGENDNIANLMSQCGISVNMSYSPTGSGANMPAAVAALKNYFKYTTVKSANETSYTDSTWAALLINELEAKRPMIYSGTDPSDGGHAWICDGYQVTSGSNYFHMNWGWSGNSNGYFLTSNLDPSGMNFSEYIGVIYNVIPSSNYPYECTGTKTITSTAGTIDDGSGPSNYLNNDDCMWLIAPADSVNHLMLAFDYLYTDSLKDVVTIYDGPTTSSPVLGTFSGDSLPKINTITSTGSKVLVRFTSDTSITDQGWQIHYSSVFPVYCSGVTTLTALTDTFDDGSGEKNNYNNGSNCKWQISPPSAASVTLHFLEFDTDTLHDIMKIYDSGTSTLLKTLSGHTLPANVTSPSGQMMVMFQTDATITDKGWKAYYTTSMAGIEDFSIIKGLNIFPNPANTSLHVSFDLASGNNAKLELVNLTGQLVYTNELQANSTTFNNDINVSKLAKGIYTLRIISSGEIVNKKVVIE